MNRIDAHHHFWDPSRADYPWLTDDLAPIRRPFGPADLRPLLDAAAIDATILVQTRSSLDETREFLAVAAGESFVAGVVGWVDLTDPGVADRIAELRAGVGGDRLVGIRHQVHDEPDPAWLARPDVRRGLRAVAGAGLAYDLLIRTRELSPALDAVRALPDLRFVIDHLAKPPLANGDLAAWRAGLTPFGGEENASAKISGLVTEADWAGWTAADLRPAVDAALDVFGPSRLMVGSDWPVCLLAAPYGLVIETASSLLGGLSEHERGAAFGGTASRVYGRSAGT